MLDRYAGGWDGRPLTDDEYVISADEKTSIQARIRCHPTVAANGRHPILVEHEYDEPLSKDEWRASWEGVKAALSTFFSSEWLGLAKGLKPAQWLEVDEDVANASFELEGVKVFAIPDFAYVDKDGTPWVVDWKTGKAREG